LLESAGQFFADDPAPAPDVVTNAFWCACHGGQLAMAEFLLSHGADLNWVGHDGLSPLDAATGSGAAALVEWLRQKGALLARELST